MALADDAAYANQVLLAVAHEHYHAMDVVHAVIEIYLHLDVARAVPALTPVIEHPDERIRADITAMLTSYGNVQHTELLIRLASTDPHVDVRYVAVRALQFHGDERALAPLQHIQATDEGCDYDGHTIRAATQEAIAAITAWSGATE